MPRLPADRLDALLGRFAHLKVLVLGDLMLDEFLWGKVSRISPEAPVPVVEVQRSESYPGGAANVVRNLAEFTPHTAVVGAVGRDTFGETLKGLLSTHASDVSGIVEVGDRHTIHKMRIIGRQQQIVRVDREKIAPLLPRDAATVIAFLKREIPKFDAVIIEDYGKGLITQEIVDATIGEARRHGKIVTVDLNPKNPLNWNGATAVKPNRPEAIACAGLHEDSPTADGVDVVRQAAAILRERWQTDYLLITLGEEGMLLFDKDKPAPYHTPTQAQKVFDVSGAGDTAIALFTLALAAGATGIEAAEISNHASGVVVGKLGTATLTLAELRESLLSSSAV
ncbi:D-beta-D-heptose 7-phosphate kinase / D-beta-D-heptose 1-phosphate adenosyltransferase [Verrucomicrobium sp. GAS474]|uniref:bifunctional heptose 7-phosphate kinase/heptose 1-phosphate adenyltransferase n=1 Tax=Verrucomicrobium sp. GAS474 TaxID=1882831 RepID=UPI00087CD22E|nr:PfkB family carbohydrate kinase [Verrucomicrobium sp. GAS474]SDU08854.1 D-beta-D-heptose 7-phosphate kinase / D-beta-D-heptose 1-phosphate adenosyltransferase [Verrucomicrobium sp. GAS474]